MDWKWHHIMMDGFGVCGWVGGVTQQIFTRKARGGEGGEGVSGERSGPTPYSYLS